jgi:hypothetical protein
MKFNLDCFVLAQVRADSEEDESPQVTIHGFYSSPESARQSIPDLKARLAEEWAQGINSFFGIAQGWKPEAYKPGSFFSISLTGIECRDFFQLEESIEAAAISAWRKKHPLTAEVI